MSDKRLKYGFTTGACAAAAASGAALMLAEQRQIDQVELTLPRGEKVHFSLQGQEFSPASASCHVVKDAGSDPDVTHGAEIHAAVSFLSAGLNRSGGRIVIEGGNGIGRVTKPGLAVPVGEWAINPVPRRMIDAALRDVFPDSPLPVPLLCTLSIPGGELLAKKTLNERLGIVGGLSILGTTGIVTPISARAWTDTIDTAIDVAIACGSRTIVLSTGRTSESAAQRFLGGRVQGSGVGRGEVPEEAFVLMGDYVGHAVSACAARKIGHLIMAGQFAKLLKIGCGHRQTHVSSSALDLQELERWLHNTGMHDLLPGPWSRFNSARHVLEESGCHQDLIRLVCSKAEESIRLLAPELKITVLLIGYDGSVLYPAEQH